jgi:hypothetical protein
VRRAAFAYNSASSQARKRLSAVLQTLNARAASARSELARAKAEATTLPNIEFNLSQLLAEVQGNEVVVRTLREKFTAANINSNAKPSSPQILDVSVKRFVAPGCEPLCLACWPRWHWLRCWPQFWKQLDQSLHSPEDVEPLINTSLLGTMPLLKGRGERRLSHLQNPSFEAPVLLESCRIVRSNLQFAALGAPLRSLLVTSADPGEGKSLSRSTWRQ